MEKIVIQFEYLDETKNHYIFKQIETNEKTIMFPAKIYLNKSLFKKQPKAVTLEITCQ